MQLLQSEIPVPNRPTRVLIYSPDSYGLGHLRRTLHLAQALTERLPGTNVLIACSSPCATHFPIPPGGDIVKLPSVTKDATGTHVPRTLGGSLDALLDLRGSLLLHMLEAYAPEIFLVDHRVLGLNGELEPVLARARELGTKTLLGLRDVIDSPEVVAREWGTDAVRRALAESYDRVCVYGVPEVFDMRVEYPIPPELGERVEFTGYVVGPERSRPPRALPTLEPQVLVTVGGGEDGADRIEIYLEALEVEDVPWESTILLGPLLDAERARSFKRRARLIGGVTVHRFHADVPRLLMQADAVVGMAGYNTVTEILQSRTPCVLLPRTFPRREQLIRAERLEALGLVECLPSPEPESLVAAVLRALARGRVTAPLPPLDGQERMCAIVHELLGTGVAAGQGGARWDGASRHGVSESAEPGLELTGSDPR